MLRLGPGETVVFQAARCTGAWTPWRGDRLHVVADEPSAPAGRARRSWPCSCAPSATPPRCPTSRHRTVRGCHHFRSTSHPVAGCVGLVDIPEQQRRDVLRWVPSDGNLALIGAFGSGTTSGLAAVVTSICAAAEPDERHVYVVDARGDERLDALAPTPALRGRRATARAGAIDAPARSVGRRARSSARQPAAATDAPRSSSPSTGSPRCGRCSTDRGTEPAGSSSDASSARARRSASSCVLTAERPGAVPAAVLAACARTLDLPPRRRRRGDVVRGAAGRRAGRHPWTSRRRLERVRGAARHARRRRRC